MNCKYCNEACKRSGRQKNGSQRFRCKNCKKYQQKVYVYQAYESGTNSRIQSLLCESVGIRGISRIMNIAKGTVQSRIKMIARLLTKQTLKMDNAIFEVDELWTYIGRKKNEYWVAYGLDQKSKNVVDFIIGKRTRNTLSQLI